MKTTTQKEILTFTIDATDKVLGRVSSEAAKILNGKTLASYQRNTVAPVKVTITNASKIKISETKLGTKSYLRYSGYPGGLTKESAGKLATRKGYAELFRNAIHGMLPANKLRPIIMKNLTITE